MPAQQTTEAARAEAGAVAGTVKDEAKNITQQATDQARTTLHRVQDDVRQRANTEATRVAEGLHQTSDRLRSMADDAGEDGFVQSLVREGADATDRLASRLDQGGLDAIMADVRSFARRSPGAFLLGAAAVGFVAGRVIRNLSTDQNGDSAKAGYGHLFARPDTGYAGYSSTWPTGQPYGNEPTAYSEPFAEPGSQQYGGEYSTSGASGNRGGGV